ncbi:MAG TPA: hypothetical protein VHZ49_03725 [Methylomirabilota bacterium]|jgi:hypothetical protein|nr:hypothetical protein [Methylomirabilota bacterium]
MNRLTADERRRAAELRRSSQARAPRALTLEDVAPRPESRTRSARVAALVTIALGGAIALIELGHQLALYGPGSLLEWLLPRL